MRPNRRRNATRLAWAALLALVLPAAAGAQDSSGTLTLGGTSAKSTADNPVSDERTAAFTGTFALTGATGFDLAISRTTFTATNPAPGAQWGSSGGTRLNALGGFSWKASEHVTLGAFAGGSPSSAFDVGAELAVGSATASALIRTDSRSYGGGLRAEFQSGGDSDLESDLTVSVSLTDISVDQSVEQLDASAVTGGVPELLKRCKNSHSSACRSLGTALAPAARTLKVRDLAATLEYTATVAQSTDVSVEVTRHGYSGDDPNGIGYYGGLVVGPANEATHGLARGRTSQALSPGTLPLVGGVPLGPPETTAGAGVSHAFGKLRLGVLAGYENYFESSANGKSVGATAALELAKGWHATLGFSHTRGTDAEGVGIPSNAVSLAVRLGI